MGKLIIGGRHCGTTGVTGDMALPACWRSKRERGLLGCDRIEPPLTAADAASRRRRFAFDEVRGRSGMARDDERFERLRDALTELGILADDVEKVLAMMGGNVAPTEDDAPSNMGIGNSEEDIPPALGGRIENAGGGSTRSYAPTDDNPGMASDMFPHANRLRNGGRVTAASTSTFHERFGTARIGHDPYANAHPVQRPAIKPAGFDERFPHAARLKTC
jgi:hypothetical protein